MVTLPARPPHPMVTATTAAARGGLLWLGFYLIEALRPGGNRRLAGRGAVAVLAAIAIGHLVKRLAPYRARPEPPGAADRRELPEQPDSSSFPSAHAASAAAFTTVVIAGRAGRPAVLGTALAAVATYGRLRTGVHFVTDLLAGIAIGVATGMVAAR